MQPQHHSPCHRGTITNSMQWPAGARQPESTLSTYSRLVLFCFHRAHCPGSSFTLVMQLRKFFLQQRLQQETPESISERQLSCLLSVLNTLVSIYYSQPKTYLPWTLGGVKVPSCTCVVCGTHTLPTSLKSKMPLLALSSQRTRCFHQHSSSHARNKCYISCQIGLPVQSWC